MLAKQPSLNGLFFTGSAFVGRQILEQSLQYPWRIVALEVGGNNPLIVANLDDIQAAVYTIIQSAFMTTGQRCTAARRLLIVEDSKTDELIQRLITATERIVIDSYSATPIDEEIFGPILQIFRVKTLEEAIEEANNTDYGLSCSIISKEKSDFEQVLTSVRSGIINWNRPTTGASSYAPFGGIGFSGNFRPSGFYTTDYTAYPIASQETDALVLPDTLCPGVTI